jgi:1,4-dihydroxy-2-naphthoyl-CoA hydrolase
MHVHRLTVQLHHTDAYGILFFANQLQFCHDAFQSWLEAGGQRMAPTRSEASFVAVVVRAEATYAAPVRLGDRLELRLEASRVGRTAFTNRIAIVNEHGTAVGGAVITQVTIDPLTSRKTPIPAVLRGLLLANAAPDAEIVAV